LESLFGTALTSCSDHIFPVSPFSDILTCVCAGKLYSYIFCPDFFFGESIWHLSVYSSP
jgi:hypothetical protein